MKYYKINFKKHFTYFFIGLFFIACEEEKNYVNIGVDVSLKTAAIYNFDTNKVMEINIVESAATIKSIKVSRVDDFNTKVAVAGSEIDATISDSKEIATFNSSIFGSLVGKEKVGIRIKSVFSSGHESDIFYVQM